MAGVVNDYLIYPILDIVRREIRIALAKSDSGGGGEETVENLLADPFAGIPSVALERKHPDDSSGTILTRVVSTYPSGYVLDTSLQYFSDRFVLQSVTIAAITPDGDVIAVYEINLLYDERGILSGTDTQRTYGNLDIRI